MSINKKKVKINFLIQMYLFLFFILVKKPVNNEIKIFILTLIKIPLIKLSFKLINVGEIKRKKNGGKIEHPKCKANGQLKKKKHIRCRRVFLNFLLFICIRLVNK